jgi:DNA repair protein RecO (recombination protein O)
MNISLEGRRFANVWTPPERVPDSSFTNGEHRARGVVLRRMEVSGKYQEVLLFLSSYGAIWVSAPGAGGASNRFGAGTEPMIWGDFTLYRSPKRLYIKGVDIREDFWGIRNSPSSLRTAVKWFSSLSRHLLPGAESDAVLSLLWGSMKNLAVGIAPAVLDVRFYWRWCNLWGAAPSFDYCQNCGEPLGAVSSGAIYRSDAGLLCGRCAGSSPEFPVSSLSAVSPDALEIARTASSLPRERFRQWASGTVAPDGLSDISSWLVTFL